jgi:hypothetical protein
MKQLFLAILFTTGAALTLSAQDGTTGTTVKTDATTSTFTPKKVNVILGNGYKIGSFTSTYGSNQLNEGDYKGMYFSVGFPININFRKYIGFTITPGIFSVNTEVKVPNSSPTYNDGDKRLWQFDLQGLNLPIGIKINLLKDFLYKGELSLVGGVNFNMILKARDENGDMSDGNPSYAEYGYFTDENKNGMGYFGGIQFSKNSGLLTIRWEDLGLNTYTQSLDGTSSNINTAVPMKNTAISISYAILFGATKRIKTINQLRAKEGLQPLTEKRGIF